MYQPPCKDLRTDQIITMINCDGEIELQEIGVYQPYFEIQQSLDHLDIKDKCNRFNKTIVCEKNGEQKRNNFQEIDEWIRTTENVTKIYIWSGCQFSILTLGLITGDYSKEGYIIRDRDDYDDLKPTDKIYTENELKDYINSIKSEKKLMFVSNTIESSCDPKEFKSSEEMYNTGDKYTLFV